MNAFTNEADALSNFRPVGSIDAAEAFQLRAIRGAVQIEADEPTKIAEGTKRIVEGMLTENQLSIRHVISFIFTVTPDLRSDLPPFVIHEAGWGDVPTLCAAELVTQGMIPRTIRLLAHVRWPFSDKDPEHVYLQGTTRGRPAAMD